MTKKIFLDPDGSNIDYIGIIFEYPTGVTYIQQCGGTDCVEQEVEGYYVPIGGFKIEIDEGIISINELTSIFHKGNECWCGGEPSLEDWPTKLSLDRIKKLEGVLASIPYWTENKATQESTRKPLKLYLSGNRKKREYQVMEAWVPVETQDGIGFLVWSNCD